MEKEKIYDLIIVGGGAAGIFTSIVFKEKYPNAKVVVIEKSSAPLNKVKLSGGGRCNLTHHCLGLHALLQHYPRGSKELLGAFHRFSPKDTLDWFEKKGIKLKVEKDGRVFPMSNRSETITNGLLAYAKKANVEIALHQNLQKISKKKDLFICEINGKKIYSLSLLLATGSASEGYRYAQNFGHSIQRPIPSLFAFAITSFPLKDLSGLSHGPVEVKILKTNYVQRGSLLLTHFGFSGPVILNLSSLGAKMLHENHYQVDLAIDWLPDLLEEEIFSRLAKRKLQSPQKTLLSENPFSLPINLWRTLTKAFSSKRLQDLSKKDLLSLSQKLHKDVYQMSGRKPQPQEFVTCGGITLKEVDFKTMESKLCPHLFFAGEILDIDALCGGFNLQNAWTTAFIAATSISYLNDP